jgi:UDP-N-acetylglucosamine diphosphorylase/glucosamine-1-phosphate N-acetyltransferase
VDIPRIPPEAHDTSNDASPSRQPALNVHESGPPAGTLPQKDGLMRFLIFEDATYRSLLPLTLLRPVFELVCGRESLRRRLTRWFPGSDWGVHIRDELGTVYAEQFPQSHVNDTEWSVAEPTLVVNGRWLPRSRETLLSQAADTAGFVDGQLVWIRLQPDELQLLDTDCIVECLERIAETRTTVDAGGLLMEHPWDLIQHNSQQLIRDFEDEGISQTRSGEHVQILGDDHDVFISETARLDPYVVIDTRTGPVSIDNDVQVQSFTRIEGPCHIGRGSQVFRGLIRSGTTIGEACRVGGEVEESILHACVNKYHEGFLGHSYVCPWVNIGAMSTTSDLKNDYSTVCVPVDGELINTGLTKVGSFFGDHAKIAVDSMFNTGSSVGVMSMVLPGGRLLPRHIPSFSYVSFGNLTADLDLDAAIATAGIAMARRGSNMTDAMRTLLRSLNHQTEAERSTAIQRVLQRRLHA